VNTKAALNTFGVALVAAYAFAVLSVKFGPFPGVAPRLK